LPKKKLTRHSLHALTAKEVMEHSATIVLKYRSLKKYKKLWPEIGTSSVYWTQLSRFGQSMEIRVQSLKCCVLNHKQDDILDKDEMMDNVQLTVSI
jgi:hypothetical protein